MKVTRIKLAAVLAFVLLLAMAAPAIVHASTPITVTVDGQQVDFQYQEPIMVNSRIFVPVREVFELMGFNVAWDPQERMAILAGGDMHIIIPADGATFYVNGETVTPDAPQQMVSGRLMLPLRAVAEAAGGTADWDSTNRVAVITTDVAHDYIAALTGTWVLDDDLYVSYGIDFLLALRADGSAAIGVEGSAIFEYDHWYVSDDGLLVVVFDDGSRLLHTFVVDADVLTMQNVEFIGMHAPSVFTRYRGLTGLSTPHQHESWPTQYAPWIQLVYDLLWVDWNDFPWITPLLDVMVTDGVDHKTLGLILIEDLIEFLDDFSGHTAFPALWEHILWSWTGWETEPVLQFIGNGELGVVPAALQNLSMFGVWVESVYDILGVDWGAVPSTSAILNSMIEAGVDHKTIALIMVEDFLEFLDDFDGYVAFPDLWEHIMADRWIILEPLVFIG